MLHGGGPISTGWRERHNGVWCLIDENPEAHGWVGSGEECFREAHCFYTCRNLDEHFPLASLALW